MNTIGNIILVIASIAYFLLLFLFFDKQTLQTKDALLGYAWLSVMLNLVILICIGVTTIIIHKAGGFHWISPKASVRIPCVTVGLLAAMLTTIFCAVFKFDSGKMPVMLKPITIAVPILVPLVLILANAILLNNHLQTLVSGNVYKWPLIGVAILGSLGIASIVSEYLLERRKEVSALQKSFTEDEALNEKRILNDIDTCDVTRDLLAILVYTDYTQKTQIRKRAISKVQSNAAWEQELVNILGTPYATEAFTFLGSNSVDHPAEFVNPVRNGILLEAGKIKAIISKASSSYDLFGDQFLWEIERILLTVNKLAPQQHDFTKEILVLQLALRQNSRFRPRKFSAEIAVEDWLAVHKSK